MKNSRQTTGKKGSSFEEDYEEDYSPPVFSVGKKSYINNISNYQEHEEIEEDSMDENDIDSIYQKSPVKSSNNNKNKHENSSNKSKKLLYDEIDEDLYEKNDLFSEGDDDSLAPPQVPSGFEDDDLEDPLDDSLEEVFSVKQNKWIGNKNKSKNNSIINKKNSNIQSSSLMKNSKRIEEENEEDDDDSLVDLATLRARRREEEKATKSIRINPDKKKLEEEKKKQEELKRAEQVRKLTEERRQALEEAKKKEAKKKEQERARRLEEERILEEQLRLAEEEQRRLEEEQRKLKEEQKKEEIRKENERRKKLEEEEQKRQEQQRKLQYEKDQENKRRLEEERRRQELLQIKKESNSQSSNKQSNIPKFSNLPRKSNIPQPVKASKIEKVEDDYDNEEFDIEDEDLDDEDSLNGDTVKSNRIEQPSYASHHQNQIKPKVAPQQPISKLDQIKKLYEENVAVNFKEHVPPSSAPSSVQSAAPIPNHASRDHHWDDDISVLTNDEFSYAPSHKKIPSKKPTNKPSTLYEDEEEYNNSEFDQLESISSSKKSNSQNKVKQIPLGKISKKILDNVYVPKETPSQQPPALPNFPFLLSNNDKKEEIKKQPSQPQQQKSSNVKQSHFNSKSKNHHQECGPSEFSQSLEFERKILAEIEALDSRKEEIKMGLKFKSPNNANNNSNDDNSCVSNNRVPNYPIDKNNNPQVENSSIPSKPKKTPAFLQPTANYLKAKAEANNKIQQIKERDTKDKRAFGPGFSESKASNQPNKVNQLNNRKNNPSPSKQTPAEIISDWKKNVQNEKIQFSKKILSEIDNQDLVSVISSNSNQTRKSNGARQALELAREAVSNGNGYLSEFQKKAAVSKVQGQQNSQLRLRGGRRLVEAYGDDVSVYSKASQISKLPNLINNHQLQEKRRNSVSLPPISCDSSRKSTRSAPV